MESLYSIQLYLNRELVALVGAKNSQDECKCLASIRKILESFKIPECGAENVNKKVLEEFLGNLEQILRLFCSCILKLKDNKSHELICSYLALISVIMGLLGSRPLGDLVCMVIIHSWRVLFCGDSGLETEPESVKRGEHALKELLNLVYITLEGCKPCPRTLDLIYILLEIFKYTDSRAFTLKILSVLNRIPEGTCVDNVYPGLASRITSKLSDLNESTFSEAIRCLTVWICHVLELRESPSERMYKGSPGQSTRQRSRDDATNSQETPHSSCDDKDEREDKCDVKDKTLEKTEQLISHILAKYRDSDVVTRVLCTGCMNFEVLERDTRLLMAKPVIKACTSSESIRNAVKNSTFSFKLIVRDVVTKSVNEMEEDSLQVYKGYLSIKDEIPCDIDFYIMLKFFLNNMTSNIADVNDARNFNYKHLIDDLSFDQSMPSVQLSELFSGEFTAVALAHFDKLPLNVKLDSFYNVVSFFSSPKQDLTSLSKLLELLCIILSSLLSPFSNSLEDAQGNKELASVQQDFKDIFLKNGMFNMLAKSQDVELNNVIKFRVISLFRLMIANSTVPFLTHRDLTCILCSIIPEYNSDFVKITQASGELLNALNSYFFRFMAPTSVSPGNLELREMGDGIRPLLSYYTGNVLTRVINSLDDHRSSMDIIYTLTSFENHNFNPKLMFDLVVALCKHFDHSQLVSNSETKHITLSHFYSFNYILCFIKKYNVNYKIETSSGIACGKENEDPIETGEGDVVLAIVTLIITRVRYHVVHLDNLGYSALLALYRCLILLLSNHYILGIRVHEVWDCLSHSFEMNSRNFRNVSIILDIFNFLATHLYDFLERRTLEIVEQLEEMVLSDPQVVTDADEVNGTIRFKCYSKILQFAEIISENVINRVMFSKIALIALKMSSQRTCKSLVAKVLTIFHHLSRKNPTLIRHLLLEFAKGERMNRAFIKFALKRDFVMPILKVEHCINPEEWDPFLRPHTLAKSVQ